MNKEIKELAVHFPRIEVQMSVTVSTWLAGLMATAMHNEQNKESQRIWAQDIWQQIHDQQAALDVVKTAKLANALKVLVLDPKINQWLQLNDPKALQQAVEALQ